MQTEFQFDSTPYARGSHTSLAAAKSQTPAKKKSDKERILEYIQSCSVAGATDDEISRDLGIEGNTVRPRRGELKRDDLIEYAGRDRLTRHGKYANVWVAK